ncbi:hypothetical protein A1Q2_02865 [Trichosporon asahii var. asahii CBS 8904]|uniref:Uncharacterized protein n=1 Tax=Trichosporon asahii var. asahii (strain CBS 8904) TaxID=1220162 RepID=K1WP53_TRIAC|nr:hypothetical protein A1Q2_02865 [Trichosporon asahii var. asahii CBS 8904]
MLCRANRKQMRYVTADPSATNKHAKTYARRISQLKTFPPRLKPINRSAVRIKKESNKSSQTRQVEIQFHHDEAVELLSQLKKRHRRSQSSHGSQRPVHWAFAPSGNRDTIETPPLPPTPRESTTDRPHNAKTPRLHFARTAPKAAAPATKAEGLPAPSRVPNSCPSEPSSQATHSLASLCGTASLRRYQLPPPLSLPSGLSTPPALNVDQEIEMWEEEERCIREREMTPPDDILDNMASWGDVPNENQPRASQQQQSGQDRTTPATRPVLGDITSQFAPPPPPSMSGVDLTAHLMSLVERLEPARGTPRRRRQGVRDCETQQPPHRTIRSGSFASKDPVRRRTRTQPAPLRSEDSSQVLLRPPTQRERGLIDASTSATKANHDLAIEGAPRTESSALRSTAPQLPQNDRSRGAGGTGVWSEFKQPSRLNATPPPEPSEVDVRHAELAEKFASFAAYIKQHEERAPPPPVLGTRVRTMSLRSTKSLGHLDGHVLGNRSLHAATQGPTR